MKKEPGYLFVDVRTPGEFAANRIAGIENKVNMPLGVLREQGKNLPVKPGEKIITSCQIDLRGYEAECILRGLGYENVHSLEGGMSGWPYATESDKKK